jgi:hypothetical protein
MTAGGDLEFFMSEEGYDDRSDLELNRQAIIHSFAFSLFDLQKWFTITGNKLE